MLKKIAFTIYAMVIFVMAMATFMEKTKGTPYVLNNVYGSWWFASLWALLAVSGIIYIVGRKMKKAGLLLLHLSFVVILTGALLTHLTAWQGIVHLRKGEPVKSCFVDEKESKNLHELPFTITLDKFNILYHNGTEAAADYESCFTITSPEGQQEKGIVSMNNIYSTHGIRLYQSGYDDDMEGTTLSLNSDLGAFRSPTRGTDYCSFL